VQIDNPGRPDSGFLACLKANGDIFFRCLLFFVSGKPWGMLDVLRVEHDLKRLVQVANMIKHVCVTKLDKGCGVSTRELMDFLQQSWLGNP
jgi:hypothetical protein